MGASQPQCPFPGQGAVSTLKSGFWEAGSNLVPVTGFGPVEKRLCPELRTELSTAVVRPHFLSGACMWVCIQVCGCTCGCEYPWFARTYISRTPVCVCISLGLHFSTVGSLATLLLPCPWAGPPGLRIPVHAVVRGSPCSGASCPQKACAEGMSPGMGWVCAGQEYQFFTPAQLECFD